MDFQKAIELLEKTEHVGIFLPEKPGLDVLSSAEVLCTVLRARGKIVGFLNAGDYHAVAHQKTFPLLHESPALPKEFIISLHQTHSPIAELRYEKLDDRVDIVVSPKSRSFREEFISFRDGKMRCGCAITLGVAEVEQLANTPTLHPEFFTETPLINIDISPHNKKYGEVNLVDEWKSSLAEILSDFLGAWLERPLPPEQATLLLAGIMEKTNRFRSAATGADALLAASELMRAGAHYATAQNLVHTASSHSLAQLYGRASVRSRVDEEQEILWSFLTPDDFAKTGRTPEDAAPVLDHLGETFPPHRARVLLTQAAPDEEIHVMLDGETPILETISTRTPAEFQSPQLKLSTAFASFREAEEYTAALLKEVR